MIVRSQGGASASSSAVRMAGTGLEMRRKDDLRRGQRENRVRNFDPS